MNSRAAIVGTLLLAGASTGWAQQRPDFSGTWMRVDNADAERAPTVAATGDASFRTGDMGSAWGSPLIITHRADSLIIEYAFFSTYDLQPPLRLAFALDGSESPNAMMIGHATSAQRSRVAWRANTLVITSVHPLPEGMTQARAAEVRHTLTLESPTSLVVETTRAGHQGGASTTTITYSKR